MPKHTGHQKYILLIEDEAPIAVGIKDNLEMDGYKVEWISEGDRGLEIAVDSRPDLILLDIMLPGMNGYEICKELRRLEINTPIIMVTAKGEEFDRCLGLDLGADDYLVKPFSLKELLARVNAQIRRSQQFQGTGAYVQFGQVQIDFNQRIIKHCEEQYHVTTTELALLKYFLDNEGQSLSRDQILNAVWGHDYFGTARTVDNFIRALRQKIESNPAKPNYLITVHGAGYCFQKKQ